MRRTTINVERRANNKNTHKRVDIHNWNAHPTYTTITPKQTLTYCQRPRPRNRKKQPQHIGDTPKLMRRTTINVERRANNKHIHKEKTHITATRTRPTPHSPTNKHLLPASAHARGSGNRRPQHIGDTPKSMRRTTVNVERRAHDEHTHTHAHTHKRVDLHNCNAHPTYTTLTPKTNTYGLPAPTPADQETGGHNISETHPSR